MKTVMKKMFSLLLVAVLLVSAVPAAFADGEASGVTCRECGKPAVMNVPNYKAATCTTDRQDAYKCTDDTCRLKDGFAVTIEGTALNHDFEDATCNDPKKCKRCGGTEGSALGHDWKDATCTAPQTCERCGGTTGGMVDHDWSAATCTAPKTCKDCGATEGELAAHTPGVDATCTAPKKCTVCQAVMVEALGHEYQDDGKCVRYDDCGSSETSTHEVYFSVNGNQEYWHLGVMHNRTVADPGFSYGTKWDYLVDNVKDTTTHEFMGWSKNPSATRGSDLEDIVLNPVTQSVTYYAIYRAKETTNSGSTDTGNGGSNNSGSNNSGSGSIGDDGLVKVHVTLHTGNTETATVELLRYKDASTRKIYASVAAHEDLIRAELAEKYPGYEWSGNVYDDPSKNQNMTETIGEGTTVYINAYTGQDMILLYVHKNRTFEPDRIIQMQGKKIGQTVTKSEVTKAVSKYYSVNSLSMYTEDDWEKLVNGKSVESASSIKVMDDDYFIIDVKISGSAKSTSGSGAKADSTNPKTGDAIFAPAMILGMSASALVVLYYLNKKRAF